MAQAIGFSVVANLITKTLIEPAILDFGLVYNVKAELENLKDTLSTINAALLDADQRQEKNNLIKLWLVKLNEVVYVADDLLDAIATKAVLRDRRLISEVRRFFSCSNQLVYRYKIGHEMNGIQMKFEKITLKMSQFDFVTISQPSGDLSNRETGSFVQESEIIGRETEKEDLIKFLMTEETNNGEHVSIIPITGIGGLGKTAIAQLVFRTESVAKHFQLMSWVCVSEDFNTKSLVLKMVMSVSTIIGVDRLALDQLQVQFGKLFDGKKYLLVLDDVWNEDPLKWTPIRDLLMGGAPGSKILVTTRNERVASIMQIGSACAYALKGLNEEQSWILFEKFAFRGKERVHPNLKSIGQEMTKRCKGVPLGIRSLASLMHTKNDEGEWLYIKNSDVWSIHKSNDVDDIITILKLSYDHLPMHLRQCFAYCSIFPKDHLIGKEKLIELWMAQGYISSTSESQQLENVGDQYFMDLFVKSFFQDIVRDDLNKIITCKMHDLIHDLAMRVGSDCSILNTTTDDISERVLHVSVVTLHGRLTQDSRTKALRTFLSINTNYSFMLRISSFKCLRVLDIHGCGVEKLPQSVSKLKHLRYLDLSRNRMTTLPSSIGNLINLQTLKLSYCGTLKTLPASITKLISLRCLSFDGNNAFTLPTGVKKLTSLRKLSRIDLDKYKEGFHLSDLNGLNELSGELVLSGLGVVRDVEAESKSAKLIEKQYLQSLILNWFPLSHPFTDRVPIDNEILLEGLQPHKELRVLEILGYQGTQFPSWVMEGKIVHSLPFIVRMKLDSCSQCKHVPPSLHRLECLKFLKLGVKKLVHIDYDDNLSSSSSSLFFPSLEELEIDVCPDLQGWWTPTSLPQHRPSFPLLRKLKIGSCPKLTSMPIAPHLEELRLTHVHVNLVHQLLNTTTTTTSSSKLRVMELTFIGGLNDLPEEIQHLVSLQYLGIISCPLLKSLPEGLRNLNSLRSLTIKECPLLMNLPEGLRDLNSLWNLKINHCSLLREKCRGTGEDWHKISHIPNIKIDDELIKGTNFV